jgi:lysophospholipase L1-like esterase
MTPSTSWLVRLGRLLLVVAAFGTGEYRALAQAPSAAEGNRFEPNVRLYEEADRREAPPANAILLAGDSQFFRWKTLHEDLPDFTIINRGIDSFQTSDLNYFARRIVLPYKPRMIVLHVGGNDVNTGKTPEQILADFKTFVAIVRESMPTVPILFTSITPGPGRWNQAEQRKRTNATIKDYIATQKNLGFIDLWDAMLTKDGQPREDIWVEDRVHPNHEGYLIRVKIMRPLLGKPDRPAR